jgi:catechol-2,3-dioxygenase
MVTDNTPQLSGLFGVYLQVGDLDRSLSFYRDVLTLEVVWNDGALAVLHGHRAPADSLVIREIGKAARHNVGEAGLRASSGVRGTPPNWTAPRNS